MYYQLNENSKIIAKSSTQLDGYYFYNEDFDIEMYTVIVGHITELGELIISKKELKPPEELAKLIDEQRVISNNLKEKAEKQQLSITTLESTILDIMGVVSGGTV